MADKKQTKKQTILHSIICGETVAEIHAHQSNTGFQYLSFSLDRRWCSTSTGRQTRGTEFFIQNTQQIAEVARLASEWIIARQQADAQDNQRMEVQEKEIDSP